MVLAGRVDAIDSDYAAGLQRLAQPLANVQLHLGYIPDPELQYYLNAADVFVLPYDKITNSGSAILSLSFNLPVLAPELPCFIALQKRFGAGWVATYPGRFDAQRMQDYFAGAGAHPRPEIDWGRLPVGRHCAAGSGFLRVAGAEPPSAGRGRQRRQRPNRRAANRNGRCGLKPPPGRDLKRPPGWPILRPQPAGRRRPQAVD